MIACLALIAFFGFIVDARALARLAQQDPFSRFAAAGLTIMFGVQSWINMAVNLRAIPAKGMTLPFISYGGSSLLALGARHGLPRRADPQAPAIAALSAARRTQRLSATRCVLLAAGRHRRPPVSRRRARGGARPARRRRSISPPTTAR